MTKPRSIQSIAWEIQREWKKVNYAAAPYLNAMCSLHSMTDKYGSDDAKSIILYFLNNAQGFRGDAAKRLKAELKALVA